MKKNFLLASLLITSFTGLIYADSTPTMSRVYGDQFVPEIAQTQASGTIGALVPTGVFGTGGSLSINTQLSGGQGRSIQVLSDGSFVTALSLAASASVVAKYTSVGTIETTVNFGVDGVASLGAGTEFAQTTMIDTQDRIVVAGGDPTTGTAGWLRRVPADGGTVQTFATGTSWRFIGGLAQQTTGKIITVGFDGTNAQIGRYTLGTNAAAGALDTTFGSSGFIVMDGTPTAVTGLYSVVVDANDLIYVAFIASAVTGGFTVNDAYIARFTAEGAFDTTWGTSGVLNIADLDAATSELYLAKDVNDNIIVGAQVSPNVVVTGVTSVGGAIGGSFPYSTTDLTGTNTYTITDLMTTSDDKIFIVGSNVTDIDMSVIRLTGTGAIDTDFNTPNGYNFFDISTPNTTSTIQSVSVAPSGQLYTTGYQINAAATLPYVSVLYNDQYVTKVAQDPATTEQGNQDFTFGTAATSTFAGVTTTFNGLYGSALQQKAQSIIEMSTGNLLVGMNGFTNTSGTTTMMIAQLDEAGAVDTNTFTNGFVTLANLTSNIETMGAMLVDVSDNIYVAGSATTGATLRKYTGTTNGVATWAAIDTTTGTEQGVGLALQTSLTPRALLFEDVDGTTGRIAGYLTSTGALDTAFGDAGYIQPTSYSLNMGPLYGGVVNDINDFYVAYKDSNTGNVAITAFQEDGGALLASFTGSTINDLFSITNVTATNVRIALDYQGNLLVAAIDNTTSPSTVYMACLNPNTGDLFAGFNAGAILSFTVTGTDTLNLNRMTGISDGTTVLTLSDNVTDDSMYLIRVLADGTGVDTTFNSQGTQQGVLPIQIGNEVADYNSRVATSALIQSVAGDNQGNIVVASYESLLSSSDSTPMIFRGYGTPGTTEVKDYPFTSSNAGTFDVAFDLNAAPSSISAGSGNVVFVYPTGNTYESFVLVGIDNGTSSTVTRLSTPSMTQDATFGTAGTYTIPGPLLGITSISIDSDDKVLVTGINGGAGWAKRLTADGAIDVSFTMPGTVTAVNSILQQKSGRYVLAGTNSTYPALIAFQDNLVSPATDLAIDPTFNPLQVGTSPALGVYPLSATAGSFYSLAINSDDTIVAGYLDTNLILAEISADGSGNEAGWNTGALVDTGITPDSAAVIRVAIDSSGKVVASASTTTGTQVEVRRYLSTGAVDTAWNSNGSALAITNLGSAGVALGDMMQTATGQTVLVGYNTAFVGSNGLLFASRLASNGTLSATWNNVAPVGNDTAGVLTFGGVQADNAISISSGAIEINGEIIMIGSTAATVTPILMLVYADDFVVDVSQNPLQSPAGTLDTTLVGASGGSLILDGSVDAQGTTPVGTITGAVRKVSIYDNTTAGSVITANGAMMIGSTNGTTTSYVAMLNADLTANSLYGASSVATLTGGNLRDMFLTGDTSSETELPILVTGDDNVGALWGARISGDGGTINYISADAITSSAMEVGYSVRQSTSDRMLVSGYNGSAGTIAAFGLAPGDTTYELDTAFGNQSVTTSFPSGTSTVLSNGGGFYVTASASPIVAMAVDSFDRIYIAYATSTSNINVERLLADGTALDPDFGTAGVATIASAGTGFSLASTQIRLVLDEANAKLIVAAQDATGAGNALTLARFGTADGVSAGTLTTITIAGDILNLSDLFVDALENIYVIGYDSSDNNSVVARVASTNATTIALDTTYATTGIASVDAGAITVAQAGALDPDRRVYLLGTIGAGTQSYMARLFGDAYTSQDSEAIAIGTPGTIDPTWGSTTPTTGQYAVQGLTGVTLASTGRAVLALSNGGSYMALDNGATSQLVRTLSTGGLDTTYGLASSGIAATAAAGVNSIMQDGSGRVVLTGTTGGAGWVTRYTGSNAGTADVTFNTTGSIAVGTVATVSVEQTSGRLVVAGLGVTNGTLFAYEGLTNPDNTVVAASVDTTFNSTDTAGTFSTGVAAGIYTLVADEYDRLIFAYLNGTTIDLVRLTPSGELDPTFGTSGIVTVTASAGTFDDTAQIRVALNSAGNIVIAAHTSGGLLNISVYDNASVNTANTNGAINNAQLAISGLSTPVLTALETSADGYIYVMGNQATTSGMFIARLTSATTVAVALDVNFGPGTVGSQTGIFLYAQASTDADLYYGLAVRPDGRLDAFGAETLTAGTTITATMIRVYNDPYTVTVAQASDSKAVGTNDLTLGLTGANGITFFGSSAGNAGSAQIARAIALQDDNNIIVAMDGAEAADGTTSQIMINKFDTDGALNLSFSTDGKATALATYSNQYVQDMVTFTTVAGVHKAIIAGYVTNTTPAITSSLLLQYNLDTAALDSTFGGFDGNEAGVAFGDGQQLFSVGRQSSGRIIAAGLSQNSLGLLLGYTSAGKLDPSFGTGGYQTQGSTGLYTHAIDTLNRIVVAYNVAGTVSVARFLADGSALDTSFNTTGVLATGIVTVSSNSNIKVAVDSSNNIVVAGVILNTTASDIVLASITEDGTTTVVTTTYLGTALGGTTSSSVYTLGRVLVDENGKIVIVASDSFPSPETTTIARFIADGSALDVSVASNNVPFNSNGYIVYTVGTGTTSETANDALIHSDGRILVVGSVDPV